jgi:deazaflavin-dependent oxidoreductase (nitroreductase family)
MKRRLVQFFQKYAFNPPIKLLFALGIAPLGYALLETTGAKSGKLRRTPVGNGLVGNEFWIVAEHGREAAYVRNLERNSRVRVKVRDSKGLRWHNGDGQVLANDDPRTRQKWLADKVPGGARNAAAVRFFGTALLTIKITLND